MTASPLRARCTGGLIPWIAALGVAALTVLAIFTGSCLSPGSHSSFTSSWSQQGAFADLDGDTHADVVRTRTSGRNAYAVEFRLSADGRQVSIPISGAGLGLRVVARDVDGDRDTDLIISDSGSPNPLGIWINDGHGGFERHDAPRGSDRSIDELPRTAAIAGDDLLLTGEEEGRHPVASALASAGCRAPPSTASAFVVFPQVIPASPVCNHVLGRAPPALS